MKAKYLLVCALCLLLGVVSYAQTPKKPKTTTKPATSKTVSTKKAPVAATTRKSKISAAINLGKDILVNFERHGGKPFMDILNERENQMNVGPGKLDDQRLSAALWATAGISKNINNKIEFTSFYPNETPCIELFLITSDGVYKYERNEHKIFRLRNENILPIATRGINFMVDAATVFVYAVDPENIKGEHHVEDKLMLAYLECGAMMENLFLFCTSEDLGATYIELDAPTKNELAKALNNEHLRIIASQAVGIK